MKLYDIGIIGLGSMAQNFARNLSNRKHSVIIYGSDSEKTQNFINRHGNKYLEGSYDIKSFANSLIKSRKIIVLVKAGELVDSILEVLIEFLDKGDLIMDASDSYFLDTIRRKDELEKHGLNFLGVGLAGGNKQILEGTSVLGGGDIHVWSQAEKIFKSIAAKDYSNNKCVGYMGQIGIAHYSNMVQNGLEYPISQILAESYHGLKLLYNLSPLKIANIFENFNKGRSSCFLLEESVIVLKRKDEFDEKSYMVEKIQDLAGYSKGGMLVCIDALKRGIPIPSIMQAVNARFVSNYKKKRIRLSKKIKKSQIKNKVELPKFISLLESSLYLAIISCYAQVFDLIRKAANDEGWNVNLAALTRVWQGGSTIQGKLLDLLHRSFTKYEKNIYVLEIDEISSVLKDEIDNYKRLILLLNDNGINCSVLTTSYNYITMMFEKSSSANFIQGLRSQYTGFEFERKK